MGTPWEDQELGEPLVDFLVKFRSGIHRDLETKGHFHVKDTDHNSPNYSGISNKQITIAAVMLDSSCKGKPFDDLRKVVMRACIGIK